MKHLNKFNPIATDELGPPDMGMQVAEFECAHCRSMMRVPVPSTFIDWEKVAGEYKRASADMVKSFDQMVKDIDVMYPENPVREYVQNKWKAIFGAWEEKF